MDSDNGIDLKGNAGTGQRCNRQSERGAIVSVTRLFPSGAIEVCAIIEGHLVRRVYYGYTRKKARAAFTPTIQGMPEHVVLFGVRTCGNAAWTKKNDFKYLVLGGVVELCPMCGSEIDEDTKICPDCKEAVA